VVILPQGETKSSCCHPSPATARSRGSSRPPTALAQTVPCPA
jgi:hypothetical protein